MSDKSAIAWPEWNGMGWSETREVREGRSDGERDETGLGERKGAEKGWEKESKRGIQT
jgi:hypothetical protein